MKECFAKFSEGEEKCVVCDVRVYCERASRDGMCDERYDSKVEECKICKDVYPERFSECVGMREGKKKEVKERKVGIEVIEKDGKTVVRRRGIREWMDEMLEKGVYVDEWNRLMREQWKRYWSIWEHVKNRKQRWGWDVEVRKEENGRMFLKWKRD